MLEFQQGKTEPNTQNGVRSSFAAREKFFAACQPRESVHGIYTQSKFHGSIRADTPLVRVGPWVNPVESETHTSYLSRLA